MSPHVRLGGHTFELTNLDKVMFPTGQTKAFVLDYYSRIAPVMVPHLLDRPLNLKRYPDGADEPFFFQKEAPGHAPDWLATTKISTRSRTIRFATVKDAASLLWIANTGNLEFHPLLFQGARGPPLVMVFDLDPGEGAGILASARIGLLLREALHKIRLDAWPKVSGGKGVQVYVPLNSPATFEQTRAASLTIARHLEAAHPELVVTNMRKDLRKGKVLIDYSQNARHKSTVAAYSLRARSPPTVSAPVSWKELEAAVRDGDAESLRLSPADVLDRVRRRGDLFAPVLERVQHLPRSKNNADVA